MAFKNKEQEKEYRKRYYQENKAEIDRKNKEWYLKHPERAQEIRKSYLQNPSNKKRAAERAIKFRNKKLQWFLSHLGTDRIYCDRCRYDKSFSAIQFHHTNPKQKESSNDSFSKWLRLYSFERFQQKVLETDFLILCANCHAELHAKVWKYGE